MNEVFRIFLRLGLTSFGGPTAHLGYFRREFVERRAWLEPAHYAEIVAFCSVLPGPTSSQTGMLIGLMRAGPAGACAAWLGFTAPSAIVMAAFAFSLRAAESNGGITASGWFTGLLGGLTAAAAAVVAQAVLALARSLCTDRGTQTIALAALILAVSIGDRGGLQWLPIAFGAAAGALALGVPGDAAPLPELPLRVSRRAAAAAAIAFAAIAALLFVPPNTLPPAAALLQTIARSGTLVFGGGHVVLPLLQSLVGQHLIAGRDFFAGYGAVQAMPGPLFTFAAFLGAANRSPLSGAAGALIATVVIFVPSFALVFALAPVWKRVRSLPKAAAALRGASASVVGLLGGVLYHPILSSLQANPAGIAIALGAYALIAVWGCAPWIAVLACALIGALAGAIV